LSCDRQKNGFTGKSVQRSGHKRALNAPVNQKGRWKNNILVKVRSATSNNNAVNPSIQFNP
jgi:hypothetical protein